MDISQLKRHQGEAITATIKSIKEGNKRNLISIPTGTGRTVILTGILNELLIAGPYHRTLIICRTILASDDLRSALLNDESFNSKLNAYQFPKIITESKLLSEMEDIKSDFFDLIILTDLTDSDKIVGYLQSQHNAIQIAFSHSGDRSTYFGDFTYVYSLPEAINDGILLPIVYHQLDAPLEEIRKTISTLNELGSIQIPKNKLKSNQHFIESALDHITEMINGQKTIIYCPTIQYAHMVCDAVNKLIGDGSYADVITRQQDQTHIKRTLDYFRQQSSDLYVLCIVDMIQSGLALTENIVIFREVKSQRLLHEMLIPGLRKYGSKKHLNLYDFAGVRHLIDDVLNITGTTDTAVAPGAETEKYFIKSEIRFRDRKDIKGVIGVDILSSELAEIIKMMPAEPGSMIGIFGKWGRGKTFLMEQTWNLLKGSGNFIKIDFHAWKYQDTPATWAYLYECLSEEYFRSESKTWLGQNYDKLSRKIRLNLKRNKLIPFFKFFSILSIGVLTNAMIVDYGMEIFKTSTSKFFGYAVTNLATIYALAITLGKEFSSKTKDLFFKYTGKHSFKEHLGLQAEIQKEATSLLETWIPKKMIGQKKVVIFVDDIDRCNEHKIVQLIDALRVLTEKQEIADRVIIIAAIDERILKLAIKAKYETLITGEHQSKDLKKITDEYIDKLFITGLKLGKLSKAEADEFLLTLTRSDREEETEQSLEEIINSEKATHHSRLNSNILDEMIVADQLAAQEEAAYQDFLIEDGQDYEYEPRYFPQSETAPPTTEQINLSSTFDKLSVGEIDILRLFLSKYDDVTPRQIRILYFRYLVAKNLLIKQYNKLGLKNTWQEKNRTAIMASLIIGFSLDEDEEALARHVLEIQNSNEDYQKIEGFIETFVNITDYRELLKVLTVVIAY